MPKNNNSSFKDIYASVMQRFAASVNTGTGKLPPQSMLRSRYLILNTIGRGGMGAVYLALDTKQGSHKVAVKEMSQAKLNASQREDALHLFKQEAHLLGSLSNAHLPCFYDSFEEQDRAYLVMDFIEGTTLRQLLINSGSNPLSVRDVVKYAIQLCGVLACLHERPTPIIFRDLKPDNIMINAKGTVFLIDFGIARLFKPGKSTDTTALGTVGYASPEQYNDSQTSPRSDLYSLGAVLHQCLTTRNPRDSPFNFSAVRQDNPSVPVELERLIQSLLDPDPQQRPASARDVQQQLAAIQRSLPPASHGSLSGLQQQPVRLSNGAGVSSNINIASTISINNPTAPPEPDNEQMLPVPMLTVIAFFIALGMYVKQQVFRKGTLAGNLHWNGKIALPVFMLPGNIQAKPALTFLRTTLSSWERDIWTPMFLARSVLLLLAGVGGSILLFTITHGSYHCIELYISLLLLGMTLFISRNMHGPIPRSILFFLALALLPVCFLFQALPDVQDEFGQLPHITTITQLLIAGMVTGAFVALLRRSIHLIWADHLTLSGVAGTAALVQYTFGTVELAQIPLLSPDSYTGITDVLALILAGIAITSLFRSLLPFTRFDRVLVLIVACFIALLQYPLGSNALLHLFLPAQDIHASMHNLQQLVTLDVIFAIMPIIVVLISLAHAPTWPGWIERVVLPVLVLCYISLFNYLGDNVQISQPSFTFYPFAFKVAPITTVSQLLIWEFIAAIVLLLFRLRRQLHWLDRFIVLATGTGIAVLQSSLWIGQNQYNSSSQVNQSMINQQFMISVSQLLVYLQYGLISISLASLLTAAGLRLYAPQHSSKRLANLIHYLEVTVQSLDRAIVLGSILMCLSLQWSLGTLLQTISLLSHQSITGNTYDIIAFSVLALAIILAIFGFIIFYRLFSRTAYPFNGVDRFPLFVGLVTCLYILFLANGNEAQSLPLLSTSIQVTGNIFHMSLPILYLLLIVGLLLTAAASFCWLLRPYKRIERNQLLLIFMAACVCIFLQLLSPVFLLIALICLSGGVFLAVQLERVRIPAVP